MDSLNLGLFDLPSYLLNLQLQRKVLRQWLLWSMTDLQLKWSDITKELKKRRYRLFQLLNYNNFYLAVGLML